MAGILEFQKKLRARFGTDDTTKIAKAGGIQWDDPEAAYDVRGIAGRKKVPNAKLPFAAPEAQAEPKWDTPSPSETASTELASAAEAAAQLTASTAVPEKSKIDTVSDRYQSVYNDSQKALTDFNKSHFQNGVGGEGGSDEMAAYNSPERGGLIRANRQAFRLLKDGSFADNANIKKEARQKSAAQASSYLADTTYKKNLGMAAISNANTNASKLSLQKREAKIAEDYLNGGTKKKKANGDEIDYLDIHTAFNR